MIPNFIVLWEEVETMGACLARVALLYLLLNKKNGDHSDVIQPAAI
jgi:hypothetical protein